MTTWTLILFIALYEGNPRGGVNATIVTGFKSEATCLAAGNQTKGQKYVIRIACVEVK